MDLGDRFQPLEQALVDACDSQTKLEQLVRRALGLDLEMIVNINQSLNDIIFAFVKHIDTNELVEKFIRGALRESNYISVQKFVSSNIDFLLSYEEKKISIKEILEQKNKLLKKLSEEKEDFSLILKTFNEVLNQLMHIQRVDFSNSVERELKKIKDQGDAIINEVRLFMILEILVSDYPFLSADNESTLDKLIFYLEPEHNLKIGEIKQKVYLEIIVQPGALGGQAILIAYLSFEQVSDGQPGSTEIIPIKIEYKQSKGSVENSAIKFNQKQAVEQILQFIKKSEEEIERRQSLGYQINECLIIEFFLPFDYLFQKIDTWTRPYGVGSRLVPLNDNYKIIFRSFERLTDVRFRRSLKRQWLSQNNLSNNSFACFSKQVPPQNQLNLSLGNKAGIDCFLKKTKSFRERLVSAALEEGISMVIWVEMNPTKTKLHLCDPQKCKNYLDQSGSLELNLIQGSQQCILNDFIQQVVRGGSLNDLHAICDSIQRTRLSIGAGGYFAVLYDEPNRLASLARLFEDTQDENLLGVSA